MDQHIAAINEAQYYIQQHQAIISPTPTPTTSSNNNNNLIFHQQPYNHQPIQYVAYNTTPTNIQQQQQQGPYQSIDFFYETPQLNNNTTTENTTTTNSTSNNNNNTTNYHPSTTQPPPPPSPPPAPPLRVPSGSITSTSTSRPTTETTNSSVDEDYVLNLANELQHTKQLLSQYQLRTEQLMNLVEKQTVKINELRDQLTELKK